MISRASARRIFAFVIFVSTAALAVAANSPEVNKGVQWLASQVRGDGSLAGESQSIATALQARAEAVRTLHQFDTVPSSLASSLANDTENNTEYMARRLVALSGASGYGAALSAQLDALEARQNSDGGFGGAPGYASNSLDTAWALAGLAAGARSTPVAAALQYLKLAQQADGSYTTGSRSDLYTSANVLTALRLYASTQALTPQIQATRAYLMSKQDATLVWDNSPWLTAIVYAALHDFVPFEPNAPAIGAFLTGSQLPDGSWGGDPYASAVILRALSLTATPPANPTLGVILGKLVDAQTGIALAGAQVSVAGASNASATTSASGSFALRDLTPGAYTLTASLANYASVSGTTTVAAAQTRDFGTIQMSKVSTATTGTIRGTVKDAGTGQPIAGATVSVTGSALQATSDATGSYQIVNVPAGAVQVQAAKDGYASVPGSANLAAGSVIVFSPSLAQASSPMTTSTVQGTITSASTGAAIAGVTVTLSGANSQSTQTNAQGAYVMTGLASGSITITAQRTGFDTATGVTMLEKNTILTFSPKLYATATTPENANKSGLKGVVVDAGSNAPLVGASISITADGKTTALTSGANGQFSVDGLTGGVADLTYALAGYESASVRIALVPLESLDIGQLRLRRVKTAQLLPDLTVESVARAGAVTNAQTLQLTGSVSAKLTNIGSSIAAPGTTVLAFHDANRNGTYDAGDLVLGRTTIGADLGVGASAEVVIAVAGKLPFRDAPIHVWIDSEQTVAELSDSNNVGTTAAAIQVKPNIGTFQPTLKWHWKASVQFPTHTAVEMAPVVMRTHDNSGDGVIDAKDTPNVAFMTFDWNNWNLDGVFRIVNGADGTELVAVRKPGGIALSGWPGIASADIDGDGLVEFLVPSQDGRIVALSNTGQFKWVATMPTNSAMYFTFGAPNIVDLDGAGSPSILWGPYVLNSNGSLRWKASGSNVGGQTNIDYGSVATDMDGDGRPEIIIGGQAYDRTGKLLWNNTAVGDGTVAVGNFNDTPAPEIVVVSNGRVFLLDNTGKTLWGPVALPGGGRGGPPTIANFNGDSKPGIGVAGATKYTVLRSDGSVLWSATIADASSSRTGSTVFDFDGDGKAEVVYSDETKLHVFAGATGATVFEQPTSSSTAAEYPVVVDLDNDGHADLITPASRATPYTGIRVFRDVNNSWVNTRSIWNQFAYHITNINDDGTVPHTAQNSWEVHNTYRLNTRPGVSPTAVPDVTASYLRINDQGGSAPSMLTVRVGNASSLALDTGAKVAFYNGTPGAGGIALGVATTTRQLHSGEYEEINLPVAGSLAAIATITAVADDDGTGKTALGDFDRSNNSVSVTMSALPGSFGVSVTTDKSVYDADGNVLISATVGNHGSLDGAASIGLVIQSAEGIDVAVLPTQATTVPNGAQQKLVATWRSAGVLASQYQVKARLLDNAGVAFAEAAAPFSVQAGSVTLSSSLGTDKAVYQPNETVQLKARLANLAANAAQTGMTIALKVSKPDGGTLWETNETLAQLAPAQLKEYAYSLPLQLAIAGQYQGTLIIKDANGTLFTQAAATFAVGADGGVGLVGNLTLGAKQVMVGHPIAIAFEASNSGNTTLNMLPLKVSIVDPVAQRVIAEFPYAQTIEIGGKFAGANNWTSAGIVGDTLVAVLTAQTGGKTLTLAQDSFLLLAPPVKLTGSLTAAPREVQLGATVSLLQSATAALTPAKGAVVTLTITEATDGAVAHTVNTTVDIASNATWQLSSDWKPTGSVGTRYVAKLSAAVGDKVFALGQDEFIVVYPPVAMSGTLTTLPEEVEIGSPSLMLRQISNGITPVKDLVVTLSVANATSGVVVFTKVETVTLASNESWQSAVDWVPTGPVGSNYVATLSAESGALKFALGSDRFSVIALPVKLAVDQAALGASRVLVLLDCNEGDNGNCADQRAQSIRTALNAMGVSHTIATTETAFKQGLRSGAFNTYWLAGKQDKLHDELAGELREAVHGGDGLILDGVHDQRNKTLDPIGGVDYRGKIGQTDLPLSIAGADFEAGPMQTSGRALKVELAGGVQQAAFTGGKPHGEGPAIVTHAYGKGRAVLFAFDLVASLQAQANWQGVLSGGLTYLRAVPAATVTPGAVLVYKTRIDNLAKEVDVNVQSQLPQGASMLRADPDGTLDAARNLVNWNFLLPEAGSKELVLTMRAPSIAGEYQLKSMVSTRRAGVSTPFGEPLVQAMTVVGAIQTATEVRQALSALVLTKNNDQKARDNVIAKVQSAQAEMARNTMAGYAAATDLLVQAVDLLASVPADTTAIRYGLDRILREAQWRWTQP